MVLSKSCLFSIFKVSTEVEINLDASDTSTIMPISVAVRSNTGCWTCRARRKKCDERGQPCSTCESLNLVCHGYGRRPDWMDGGVQERAQARAFKAVVKRSNILRRQRKSQDISSQRRVEQLPTMVRDAFYVPGAPYLIDPLHT